MTSTKTFNTSGILPSVPTKQVNNNSILYINNNTNKNIMSLMPSKFKNSDDSSTFSNGRKIYLNIGKNNENIPTNNYNLKKAFNNKNNCTCNTNCKSNKCECKNECIISKKNNCNVGKYLQVQSSGQRIERLKNNAIGKGNLAKQLDNKYISSFSANDSINYQNTKQALRRIRNRGYVVPPKVIANSKNSRGC